MTSRVVVNRIWAQFFGAGLVRTPEDFGTRGELPTNPELLDWLAVNFQSHGWDIKRIVEMIVMSSTYRQSSALTPVLQKVDSGNRLLARNSRFRLTAEEIRDAALAASGLLVGDVGGPSVYPYQPESFYRGKGDWKWPQESGRQSHRRGLYTFIRRTSPYPAFQTFDAPSRGECTVSRMITNTPLQALITLNDPVYVEAAQALAQTVVGLDANQDERMTYLFRSVLCRFPNENELFVLHKLYADMRKRNVLRAEATADMQVLYDNHLDSTRASEVAAWKVLANVLLNLDEAITRE